jgi:hypothetical protein
MSKTEQQESVLNWRKSTRSVANGACVEAATIPGTVMVRDSVTPSEVKLRFAAGAWQEFIDRLKGA